MKNSFFSFQQFTIHQDRCAMKVGTDGTLLGAWASVENREKPLSFPLPVESREKPLLILDVGTGTGLIALMMAQRFPEANVVGIDIDAEAVAQAQENVAASPFSDRITILQQDFADTVKNREEPWHVIVCNPPFFTQSLLCPDDKRTMARHDGTLNYRTLATNSWQLLSDDGELSVIVPADQHNRMEAEATMAGFSLCRECKIITAPGKPVKRVLLAFRKHQSTPQRTTLTIGSEEYLKLTGDFYLKAK